MSKPDLDIIRSPEAEAFLRMVTKGFYDRSYAALWMYEVTGREWDEMRSWSEALKLEIFVQTCTWSIGIWEWVFGFEPDETMTLEERRQRILNRVRGIRPINPEAVRRGVKALSQTETEVNDLVGPYRFEVILHPQNQQLPCEKILKYLRDVKPSHLSFDFRVMLEAKAPAYIYAGVTAGIQAHIGMAEESNTYERYEHQETVYVGGLLEIRSTSGIPEASNDFDFSGTIRTGGIFSGQELLALEEDSALPPSISIQRIGTVCNIISNLSQEE